MKTKLALLAAIVLAIVLGWQVVVEDGEPEELDEPSSPQSHQRASVEEPPGDGRTDFVRSALRAEAAPDPPAEQASREGITVRAIRSSDGSPVPGARITYFTAQSLSPAALLEAMASRWSFHFWESRGGNTLLADDQGIAVLPLLECQFGVTGTADGLWGCANPKQRTGEELVLPLQEAHPFSIQVLDRAGHPVSGVKLIGYSKGYGTLWSGRTEGVEGIARVEGFASLPRSEQLLVDFAFPTESNTAAVAKPEELGGKLLRMTLPPTGSVRVQLLGDDGEPFRGNAAILLSEHFDLWGRFPRPRQTCSVVLKGEGGHFAHVGLGLSLSVVVLMPNGEREIVKKDFRGPTQLREELTLRLPLGAELRHLSGRLLSAEGEPLVHRILDASFGMKLVVETGTSAFRNLMTDGQGRFQLPIEGQWTPDRGECMVMICLPGADWDAAVPASRRVCVDLARSFPPGATELGDLRLGSDPFAASGFVLDGDGQPVAGALVEFRREQENGRGRSQFIVLGHEISNARGAFEIRVPMFGSRELHLQARVPGEYSSEWVAVHVGATDVVLRVLQLGEVAGRLLVDEEVPLDSIVLRLQRGSENVSLRKESDGSFRSEKLESGSYSLRVCPRRADNILASIDDILVPAGGAAADARLQPLDLRGKVAALRMRLLDAEGRALSRERVRIFPYREGGSCAHALTDDEGRALLLVKERAPQYQIAVDGHHLARAALSSQEKVVQLDPGILVELVLPPEALRIEKPYGVSIQLRSHGVKGFKSPTEFLSTKGLPEEDGRVRVRVPTPGEYAVQWSMVRWSRRRKNRKIERRIDPDGPPQIVTVLPGANGQAIPVAISREVLLQARF